MSWDELDAEEEKARKILGDDAKFPPEKVDLQALIGKQNEAFTKFKAGRDELEKLLEAFEDASDAIRNGIKPLAAAYQVDDFGLDEKKKDDAKKIQQAQKMYSAFFAKQ